MSSIPSHGKVLSIQHYVKNLVSDLLWVRCFLQSTTVSSTNNIPYIYSGSRGLILPNLLPSVS